LAFWEPDNSAFSEDTVCADRDAAAFGADARVGV
jgi:hypothetical protein